MKKSSTPNKAKLTIVTVNYNSAPLVADLVQSITNSQNVNFKIKTIVVDNNSTDDSVVKLKKIAGITFIESRANKGFAYGNNLARPEFEGQYVWFLNPDTAVESDTIAYMIDYMDSHPDVGLATPKLVLPNGKFDKNCHRSFPGVWSSLTHFMALDKVFPRSRLFSAYYLGYLSEGTEAEVDVVGGSSALIRREIGEKIGWWDEDYFMYGEDIELAWQVKSLGYKVMYVPEVIVHHYHGASSGLKKTSQAVTVADATTKRRAVLATTEAMRIFYQKHVASTKPGLVNQLVYLGIYLMEKLRLVTLSV